MNNLLKFTFPYLLVILAGLLFLSNASAQPFEAVKAQVKEHTLSNGMKIIQLGRHDAPVVSFHIYADVGSANESYGITGISHILEHMAFKGTKHVGTKNFKAEKKLLDEGRSVEEVYQMIEAGELAP